MAEHDCWPPRPNSMNIERIESQIQSSVNRIFTQFQSYCQQLFCPFAQSQQFGQPVLRQCLSACYSSSSKAGIKRTLTTVCTRHIQFYRQAQVRPTLFSIGYRYIVHLIPQNRLDKLHTHLSIYLSSANMLRKCKMNIYVYIWGKKQKQIYTSCSKKKSFNHVYKYKQII